MNLSFAIKQESGDRIVFDELDSDGDLPMTIITGVAKIDLYFEHDEIKALYTFIGDQLRNYSDGQLPDSTTVPNQTGGEVQG